MKKPLLLLMIASFNCFAADEESPGNASVNAGATEYIILCTSILGTGGINQNPVLAFQCHDSSTSSTEPLYIIDGVPVDGGL